ncbi:hypothetical protein PS662_00357 [Pseudomonas fluorescens]|uniref:Uncharacterized protein n=1 Tax=Pseudomonas fluorescens TaxID=294 RepID=A0A5E6PL84_PSEFL|nr:hypothetical protein PS662_00357 [Pseudomonas fluorescens]
MEELSSATRLRSFDLEIIELQKDRSLVALDSSYAAPTQLLRSSWGQSRWSLRMRVPMSMPKCTAALRLLPHRCTARRITWRSKC